jgi:hypothetical protein
MKLLNITLYNHLVLMEFITISNNKQEQNQLLSSFGDSKKNIEDCVSEKSKHFLETENILRYILNITQTSLKEINLNMIMQSIDKLEYLTGYKLFNKSQICNQLIEIPNEHLLLETKNIICKNVIMQIDFNKIFKSNLNFTFIIKDSIVILYKNKQVDANNIFDIKKDLIKNNIDIFPIIYEGYIDTLCNIIMQFINKDLIVKYYCINIPIPYWKLFELKCGINGLVIYLEKCIELDAIISGKYYQINQSSIISPIKMNDDTQYAINEDKDKDEDEVKLILMQINKLEKVYNIAKPNIISSDEEYTKLDTHYRMEVMSYLNDTEMEKYLEIIEKIDEFDKNSKLSEQTYINTYIKTLIDAISSIKSTIAKFYYIYKLYDFICKIPHFIKIHTTFRKTITNKINEFADDMYIIQTAGLKLSDAIMTTLNKIKELIDTIEKTNNPNYVSSWAKNSQYSILNEIVNKNNLNTCHTDINNNPPNTHINNNIELGDLDNTDYDEDDYATNYADKYADDYDE